MNIVCLDLEGVLVPEIWIAFSQASGIPELKRTTRDEPDYDKLMKWRLGILKEHGLGLKEIQDTIATIDPMPGAKEFLDELRSLTQVIIISDTFTQFATPLMKKLGWPTIFCNSLEVAAIHFNADQTLVGTALNLLGPAAAVVIVRAINTAESVDNVSSTVAYKHAKKAFLVNIGRFEFSWFMLLALVILIVAYLVLYKTKFGLRLMACGEHPQAADSVGINVYKMRYAGVLISGVLGGLGGLVYITAGVSEWKFENGVAGFGFLALAVMIFGQWKPVNIGMAAVLFGLFRALSNVYTGFPALVALKLPSTLYNMFPYIISLLVLVFVSKNSRAPKAEGIPYDKGQR